MTPRELLHSGAENLGISLSIEQINSVFLYLAELNKWNQKINLTAIVDEKDSIIKHVLDSLSYIHGFTPAPELRLLDLGSGAGFPALPIKIACPETGTTLVESTKKKASFLRHIVRMLKLTGVEILDTRAELLSGPLLSSFDVVTARAFADMKSALVTGVPFLSSGGLMVLSRGPDETISDQDLDRTGVSMEQRMEFTLPHSKYQRVIWVFKKIG